MKINDKILYLRMRLKTTLLLLFLFVIELQLQARSGIYLDLRKEFGKNKTFITEVELPALIALSYFPELKNASIKFEYKNIATTMAAQPEFSSVLSANRKYVIYINSEADKVGSISFSSLNLEQKVGIIAHELAHLLDYENRTNISILTCGVLYKLNNPYKRRMERETDEMVISKGLGSELYSFSNFVINESTASLEYKKFKLKNYLSPEEIKSRLK